MSKKVKISKRNQLDSYNNNERNDHFSLGFGANIDPAIADSTINKIIDDLLANDDKWSSVNIEPFDYKTRPQALNFIRIIKSRGMKVHLRCGFSRNNRLKDVNGNFEIFATGNITSKTEVANTAVPILGQRVLDNSSGTITDTTKNWITDEWKGYQVYCKSITNKDLVFYIISNTNNTLTIGKPVDINETDSVFLTVGSDLIDTAISYSISYQCANDNAFTNTTRGLYKRIKEVAIAGLAAGADSFSCCNEFINNIQFGVPNSIFETEAKLVQEQKNLVQYIKTQVPGYTEGYTVSEIFWQTDNWISSNSIAPLDFLAYTAYEDESTYFGRLKALVGKFGADKIQQDEMSCQHYYEESLRRGIHQDEFDWTRLLNNRIKYCKNLGIRAVYRWELWDFSGTGSGSRGFGYTKKLNNNLVYREKESWFENSYAKNISKIITNHALSFNLYVGSDVRVPNNTSLALTNNFTIQFKIHTQSNENQNIISKSGSYNFRVENQKFKFTIKINGTDYTVSDTDTINGFYIEDRWAELAVTYDNSNIRLFVAGKLKATQAVTGNINNSTDEIIIGKVKGRIQDIEVSKDCLFINNYEAKNQIPNSQNAVLRLLTDQSSGNTIKDTSRKNNNGTTTLGNYTYFLPGSRDQILEEDKASEFWKNNLCTGYNIAGLEFAPTHRGLPGINYPASISRKYLEYCYNKGINAIRLPITLERLLPVPYAEADKNYSNIIKNVFKNAQDYGIKVFLDLHQYGEYNFVAKGGFVGSFAFPAFNVFDSRYKTANNKLEIRNPTNTALNHCFETITGGSQENPKLPNAGYSFKTQVQVLATKNTLPKPNFLWEGLDIFTMYKDDNNYYSLYWNDTSKPLELYKKVNGVITSLGFYNLPLTPELGITKLFEIDVNQSTIGDIIVKLNNVEIIRASHDTSLSQGQVGFRCQESIADILSYELNIGGDTSSSQANSGIVKMGTSKGSSSYDLVFNEFIYSSLHSEFDSYDGFEGYMYNEPHGLPVETTPLNYKTTSTATIFQQNALNKLRALGSTKWFGWTSDNYGGLQNLANETTGAPKWGENFDFPWTDPLNKTFLDLHFYHDFYPNSIFSGSGTFGSIVGSGQHRPYTRAEIITNIEKVIKRVNFLNVERINNGLSPVPLNISELGTPILASNGALPNSDYIGIFEEILKILRANNIGFFYFGIGPTAGNKVDGIFADIMDSNGEPTIEDSRHRIISKYLNN